MNVAIDPKALLVERPLAARRETRLRLGMPQLCLGGLSETWLLKQCGDLHWRLLADLAGMEAPDFRDADGAKVYAAFRALSAEGVALGRFDEHDELRIVSDIRQVSAGRFALRHAFSRGSEPAGSVELLSAFVRRSADGHNRSIVRTSLKAFPARPYGLPEPCRATRLLDDLRKHDWQEHRGFRRAAESDDRRVVLRPCPSQDFNGARLLYFAAYQGLADRAEWELLGMSSDAAAETSRDMVFHGNAEPGEPVAFTLRGHRREGYGVSHWLAAKSAADGRPLADIFTVRSAS